MSLSPATAAALRRAGLEPELVAQLAERTLAEDLAWGPDITTESIIPASSTCAGAFVARRSGVLAGAPVAAAVLEVAAAGSLRVELTRPDGAAIAPGETVLSVEGPTRPVLQAERSALNLLCHLSGVATLTRAFVEAVSGTGARIRDTRKTTPGLRVLEKYAVRCGGGLNHRMGLGDAALIKDNHVVAAGSLRSALQAVRAAGASLEVEVECDTLDQVAEALEAGAGLILLDNMDLSTMRQAVSRARRHPGVRVEASGGLDLERAPLVAATGVDYLAVGSLTHSAPVLDIGLDLLDSSWLARPSAASGP